MPKEGVANDNNKKIKERQFYQLKEKAKLKNPQKNFNKKKKILTKVNNNYLFRESKFMSTFKQ